MKHILTTLRINYYGIRIAFLFVLLASIGFVGLMFALKYAVLIISK